MELLDRLWNRLDSKSRVGIDSKRMTRIWKLPCRIQLVLTSSNLHLVLLELHYMSQEGITFQLSFGSMIPWGMLNLEF